MKRMQFLVLLITMMCLVSYGCGQEKIIVCFPTATFEFASMDELRAAVLNEKKHKTDSAQELTYEEINLADMDSMLLPLSDFNGCKPAGIRVDEKAIHYFYTSTNSDAIGITVEISRPETCTAESFYDMQAEEYGKDNEIEQYLYNEKRGAIISIIDDFCVCIRVGKNQEMNDFEYLKNCFQFETIYFN